MASRHGISVKRVVLLDQRSVHVDLILFIVATTSINMA